MAMPSCACFAALGFALLHSASLRCAKLGSAEPALLCFTIQYTAALITAPLNSALLCLLCFATPRTAQLCLADLSLAKPALLRLAPLCFAQALLGSAMLSTAPPALPGLARSCCATHRCAGTALRSATPAQLCHAILDSANLSRAKLPSLRCARCASLRFASLYPCNAVPALLGFGSTPLGYATLNIALVSLLRCAERRSGVLRFTNLRCACFASPAVLHCASLNRAMLCTGGASLRYACFAGTEQSLAAPD